MLTREDREHSHTIASDGELFAYLIPYQNLFVTCITNSFVCSFKQKLDRYINSIPDLPCSAGYNNSLDGGDCLQRRTLRDDLVAG